MITAEVVCKRDRPQKFDENFVKIKGNCEYGFGESCRYECLQGYVTGGVTVSACRDNGKMYPPLPKCTRKYLSGNTLVTS